ncbi:MAG: hypothetical protein IT168_22290 [Bryobacterales bacterium]|nr:hypothetical protein [Bryobacterales bacterium]
MRLIPIALFWIPLAFGAMGNFITFSPAATQANRPFDLFPTFAKDELCDYPRPYVDGVAKAQFQADIYSRWPASSICTAGSVKKAWVAFHHDVIAGQAVKVDFRNNAAPCHLSSIAECSAAGMDQATMLGRTWDAQMNVTPFPTSTDATTKAISARTMLAAGAWSYRRRGPIVTQVVVEDRSTARSYDFGWRDKRVARVTGTLQTDFTSFKVAADWSRVAVPFKVMVDSEIVSVCYATYISSTASTTLYLGTTAGIASSCASSTGHGQDGTPIYNHYAEELRTYARLLGDEPMKLAASIGGTYSSTLTLQDASSINSPVILNVMGEMIRVCNKSGNVLTVGTGAWGCTADAGGRSYWGTNTYRGNAPVAAPVYNWSEVTDAWVDADQNRYKSLHPVFVITQFANWPATGIEYHVLNVWHDRLQDQMYTVAMTRGGGVAVSTASQVLHKAMTMWKYPDGPVVGTYGPNLGDRKIWDGTAPSAGRFDFNHDYLRYVGAVPHDPNIAIDTTGINGIFTSNRSHDGNYFAWDNSNKAAIPTTADSDTFIGKYNCAGMHKPWGAVGGRPDIAPIPMWTALGVYAMKSPLPGAERWAEALFGASACAGYAPIHVWEGDTDTNRKFCAATDTIYKSCTGTNATVPAFGRPWSIDARPLSHLTFDQANAADPYNGRLLYQGYQTFNNFGVGDGNSHQPQLSFIPWLLSGDWFYETTMRDEGAWSLMNSNSDAVGRKGSWGWPSWYNMTRPISWFIRTMSLAAWAQPSGSPDEEYFVDKINKFVEIFEGKYNITSGMFYRPCTGGSTDTTSTPWCWGRRIIGKDAPNLDVMAYFGGVASWGWNDWGNVDQKYVYHIQSYWMENYGRTSMGWSISLGFTQLKPLYDKTWARDNINRILHPDTSPYTMGEYRDPSVPCRPEGVAQTSNCNGQTFAAGEQWQFATYGAYHNSWNSIAKAKNMYDNDLDKQGGYSLIASSVTNFVEDARDGSRTGTRAQEWMKYAIRKQSEFASTPMFSFSSDRRHRLQVRAYPSAGGNLTFVFTGPNSAACSYAIGNVLLTDSRDDNDVVIPGGAPMRKVTVTGLTPGAKHLRVTCGNSARGNAYFTAIN